MRISDLTITVVHVVDRRIIALALASVIALWVLAFSHLGRTRR